MNTHAPAYLCMEHVQAFGCACSREGQVSCLLPYAISWKSTPHLEPAPLFFRTDISQAVCIHLSLHPFQGCGQDPFLCDARNLKSVPQTCRAATFRHHPRSNIVYFYAQFHMWKLIT